MSSIVRLAPAFLAFLIFALSVTAADRPIPASPVLEKATLPGAQQVAEALAEVLKGSG